MILSKIITEDLKDCFANALVDYRSESYLVAVGFFDKGVCVGGAYLQSEYPNKLVMEFYTKCPSVVYAIAESFKVFFGYKKVLLAEVHKSNKKCLKFAKQLRFKKTRVVDDFVHFQFSRENWKYNRRHKI